MSANVNQQLQELRGEFRSKLPQCKNIPEIVNLVTLLGATAEILRDKGDESEEVDDFLEELASDSFDQVKSALSREGVPDELIRQIFYDALNPNEYNAN